MKLVIGLSCLLAVAQAASILPIDSSSVSVKNSGKEFSYTIHENRGIAVDSALRHIVQPQLPATKTIPVHTVHSNVLNQGQTQIQSKIGLEGMMVKEEANKMKTPTMPEISYTIPLPTSLNYLPIGHLPLAYPYNIHYPYNIIQTV